MADLKTQKKSPAPASTTPGEVKKPEAKKPPKITLAQAKTLVTAGVMTEEKVAEMVKQGLITDGTGGGEDVMKQFSLAGVPQADIDALEKALEKVNAALWGADKKFIGKTIVHSFNKKAEDGTKSSYDAPAEIEAALWCKHFEVKKS